MAAQINLRKSFIHLLKNQNKLAFSTSSQCAGKKKKHKQVHTPIVVASRQLESMKQSLASKGFLRSYKPYAAPENASERVQRICASLNVPQSADHKLNDIEHKFKLLAACYEDFKHAVPNSQVHEIQTVGDVIQFYCTSLDTATPYEALKRADLPENLHIQHEYLRFHPETDTKFNGQTAFPKSSTLVTGLKYRGKYEGHEAKRSWP